jgi:hypothetical protein
MWRVTLVVLAALLVVPTHTPGQTTPSLLEAVRKAAPPRVDGPIPTHFSPGAEQRAKDLQGVLAKASAFYQERLGLSPTFTLALLDPQAWKSVTGGAVPYGLPFVNGAPPVMVMPFRQEGAIVTGYMANASRLPAEVVKLVEASRRPFAAHVADMVDLVGYHELGHLYVGEWGINPHTRWFSELLATYFGYAFLAERLPELARTWEIVYSGVGADNYIWYQGRFSERVFAIFAIERLDFLRKVKDAFPGPPNERLASDQLLEQLEKVRPGFKEWVRSVESHP